MKKIIIVVIIMALVLTGCSIKHETIDVSLTSASSEETSKIESSAVVYKGGLVETKEQAIAIAKEYVLKKYNKSFDEYEIKVSDASEYINVLYDGEWAFNTIWFVAYDLIGGPAIYIRKIDGSVIACMLQSPAETKEQAIAIAKEYVFEMYNKSFEEDEIEFSGKIYHYEIFVWDASKYKNISEGEVWVVGYGLVDENGEQWSYGGGGPGLDIRRSDGRVISCYLQK